jgi:glycosyltransferase involved in cell wall biosynthesis
MQQRRIVIAMLEPPLPFGNAAARWYYVLLKGLVERGHRVTAFAACSKQDEIRKAKTLFPDPEFDLRLYPFPEAKKSWTKRLETLRRPYSFMFSRELQNDLQAELARGYDILHLEQLWCGWLGIGHENRALVNVHHLVWIDLGSLNEPGAVPQAVKLRNRLENQLMFWAERRLVKAHHHFRSCSPRLVAPMRQLNPGAEITTVPVGIDPARYPYIPDERRSQTATLSLIGSMAWYPGYSAAVRLLTRLWPEIKRRVPHARLQIVGWSARSALKEFLDAPGVEIAENVPDTQPYFDRTNVMLYAPSRGSGMKIKILEAMAFGVPVVTTSEGVEGIPAQDGVHAGVCEDDEGLIDRSVALLEDPELQNQQRRAARALLESHCGPKPTLDAIESIYTRMLEKNR